jgi:parvulin-like peptidyl-prolyl isomerase
MDAPDGTLRLALNSYQMRWYRAVVVILLLLSITSGCSGAHRKWWRRPDDVAIAPPSAANRSTDSQAAPTTPASRQASWETSSARQQANYPEENKSTTTPVSVTEITDEELDDLEPTRIVARVGDEVILAGDVLGPINQALAQYQGQLSEEELQQNRVELFKQQLPSVIETKLLYVAYLRFLNKQAQGKDINEALPKIWERVHSKFDQEELPKFLEKYKLETAAQLDAKLREFGWSLAKQRRNYGERNLGMAAAYERIRDVPETTHEEMLKYYEQRLLEYDYPAQVRWEQLTVRFDKFPNRQAAYRALAAMGNEVAFGGSPLWAVAKRDSQGFNAKDGGQYDWTNQGSLASEALDQAIFTLPINELSKIIEDNVGFHIVRVLERREAGRTQFTDAQVEIKKKIEEEKRRITFKKYMSELQRDIPVWTIYDGAEGRLGLRPDHP